MFQANRFDVCCFLQGPKSEVDPNSEGILYKLFKVLYVPLLMKSVVRAAVMVVFFGWVCASVAVIPHIEVGLDQELSMSEDSYVYKYFKVMSTYNLYTRRVGLHRNGDSCCRQKFSMYIVYMPSSFLNFIDFGWVLSCLPLHVHKIMKIMYLS